MECKQQADRLKDGEQVYYNSRGEVEIETTLYLGPNDHRSEHLVPRDYTVLTVSSCQEDSIWSAGDPDAAF